MPSPPNRIRLALAALVALGLTATACGGSKDDTATTTTKVAPTTTSPSTTTKQPTSTACDSVSVPAAATRKTTTTADVDGDGKVDEIRTFLVGDSDWHLQVTLAAGGGADLHLATFDPGAVAVLGGIDLDGDGSDEIWARTGSGASATILGLVSFADCSLKRVTFTGGDPVELAVGGSVGTASGVECSAPSTPGGAVTAYTASNTGDNEYQVTATTFALDGTVLVQRGSSSSTVSTNDPLFERATSFTCGDLHL